MKIVEMRNIFREEGAIYYFRKFTADAIVQLPLGSFETPISFSIETNPLGLKNIEITLSSSLNYPVLPIKNALKEFIEVQDAQGKLP